MGEWAGGGGGGAERPGVGRFRLGGGRRLKTGIQDVGPSACAPGGPCGGLLM